MVEVDLVDVAHGLRLGRLAAHLARGLQREHHVLLHGLPGQQLVELLEHEHAVGARPAHRRALEAHVALGRRHVAADGLEQRGLAAPRGAEHDVAVGPVDVEADAIGGGDQMLLGLVLQGHAAHLQQRRAAIVGQFRWFGRHARLRGWLHRLSSRQPWISGKNKSFQLAGMALMEPTECMNSAYFMRVLGRHRPFHLLAGRDLGHLLDRQLGLDVVDPRLRGVLDVLVRASRVASSKAAIRAL